MKATTNRREFIRATAATTLAATLAPEVLRAAEPRSEKMVGMQVGAVSFVDEGVEPVLDLLQSNGAVNTIFLTTFTYGRGLARR